MNISNFNNSNYFGRDKKQNSPSFRNNSSFIRIGNSCLSSIEKGITPDTVAKLDTSIKLLLDKNTPKRIKELAQVNCFAADKIKTYFDNLYGKNNYTIIAIGRSVASIAETVKYMGSDVKIIPLSGLRRGLPEKVPDADVYKKFLNKIGINLDILENNKNRKYILFDYEYSGNSLQNTDKFIRRDILKGNPKNLIKISINEVLRSDFQNNFRLLFSLNRFKEFSSVGKLDIMDLKNCFKQSSESTAVEYQSNMAKYLRKNFLFNIFNCIEKGKYINSCEEELMALDKHYLSQKAMRVRVEQEFKKFRIDENK